MKRLFVAGVGLLALASAAAAADLPPAPGNYYKAPAFVPPFSWTGFYLGVNGGGGLGWSNWDTAGGFHTDGGVVGGTVGYNYQIGHAVIGGEGDIDWSSISGSTTSAGCPAGCGTSNSWLSTVRARLGYAADRFMPYVTGGAAFGNINATTPGLAGGSATNAGWTIGGGLEVAIAGGWSAKAEYLFIDLGKFNCGIGCGAASDNVSFNTSLIRGGFNYRF
ncbi:MAG TPA: outer membrane beta-barrel protein [Xanthobacteraceae bacterium]|nr:outer membrane beta-barrel protein [Xanthobacteraceae bacterium]